MNRLLAASCTVAATGLTLALGSSPAFAASSGSGGNNSFFNNCSEARAAGQDNIPETQATYREELDQDRDGVACEDNEGSAGSTSGSTSGSGSTGSLSTGGTGASGGTSGGGSGTIRINTGTGGQADPGSSSLPAVVGGVGVLVLGGSVIALRRRSAAPRS